MIQNVAMLKEMMAKAEAGSHLPSDLRAEAARRAPTSPGTWPARAPSATPPPPPWPRPERPARPGARPAERPVAPWPRPWERGPLGRRPGTGQHAAHRPPTPSAPEGVFERIASDTPGPLPHAFRPSRARLIMRNLGHTAKSPYFLFHD